MPGHAIIVRGLPGSGRTNLAKSFAIEHKAKVYSIDPHRQPGVDILSARQANQVAVWEAMRAGETTLIIDDFCIRPHEASPYVRMAKFYDYSWGLCRSVPVRTVAQMAAYSGVAEAVIEAMARELKSYDNRAMSLILEMHDAANPFTTLRQAQMAMETGDYIRADEYLADYETWRTAGGFEPSGGDAVSGSIASRIARVTSSWLSL